MSDNDARKAHAAGFADSLAGLRELVPEAVNTLRELLRDRELAPQARITAARVILDHAARSWDLSQKVAPPSLADLLDDLAA
jgi:hypothetical protein